MYVAWIRLCERCKFCKKICYSNRDNEFFLRDCFLLAHPVYVTTRPDRNARREVGQIFETVRYRSLRPTPVSLLSEQVRVLLHASDMRPRKDGRLCAQQAAGHVSLYGQCSMTLGHSLSDTHRLRTSIISTWKLRLPT